MGLSAAEKMANHRSRLSADGLHRTRSSPGHQRPDAVFRSTGPFRPDEDGREWRLPCIAFSLIYLRVQPLSL